MKLELLHTFLFFFIFICILTNTIIYICQIKKLDNFVTSGNAFFEDADHIMVRLLRFHNKHNSTHVNELVSST